MSVKRFGVLVMAGLLLAAPLSAQTSEEPGPPSLLPPSGGDLSRFLPRDGFREDGRRTMGAFAQNLGRNFVGVFSKDNLAPFLIGASVTGAGSFFYDMAQAFIVTATYTEILKRAVGRPRPDLSDNRSFPSGHTSNAFALATVANAHFGPKIGVPAYLAAVAIGAARVDKNVHNLSDVLAGATLGYVVGRTVVKHDGTPQRKAHFQIVPSAPASGAGVGAGFSVDW